MTEDDKALVERLREEADEWDEPKSHDDFDMRGMLHSAADRIEAQAAEIERLKRSAEYWEQDAKRYAANQEHWRMEERAAIVAWLRKDDFLMTADAIEAGEHLK